MSELAREQYIQAETHIALSPVRDRGRCVLVFPNAYRPAMSSLSLHTLYFLLNSRDLLCERAFLPDERPLDTLRSLESGTPLAGFDFVLITSSFELDWLNIPAMLQAGGVPPMREDRTELHPLVIGGGPAITANPEPLADMFDALVIGELEPIADAFVSTLAEADTREEVLEGLRAISTGGGPVGDSPNVGDTTGDCAGIYLPHLPGHAPQLGTHRTRVRRLCAEDLDAFSTESVILTPHTTFGNRFLIEVGRGCGRSCKFCLARRIYQPVRAREPRLLLQRVDQALSHTRMVGLVGAAISDYPRVDELFNGLLERGVNVSVSSVRAESVTESLAAALGASGQDTLTIAPEAGSEDLRRQIGKAMTDQDILHCIGLSVPHGITRFKLYYMVGLPGQTQADVRAIPAMVASLRSRVPEAMFSVSLNPFVPKPHTPFAREAQAPEAQVRKSMSWVAGALRREGVRDITVGSARWAAAQAVLSRGGRQLGPAIVQASLAGGGYAALKSAVKRHGGNWSDYTGPQTHPEGTAPWDIVSHAYGRRNAE